MPFNSKRMGLQRNTNTQPNQVVGVFCTGVCAYGNRLDVVIVDEEKLYEKGINEEMKKKTHEQKYQQYNDCFRRHRARWLRASNINLLASSSIPLANGYSRMSFFIHGETHSSITLWPARFWCFIYFFCLFRIYSSSSDVFRKTNKQVLLLKSLYSKYQKLCVCYFSDVYKYLKQTKKKRIPSDPNLFGHNQRRYERIGFVVKVSFV